MEKINIAFARIYNPLPKWLKIALMVTTSFIASSFLTQILVDIKAVKDLEAIPAMLKPYVTILVDSVPLLLTPIINVLQEKATSAGTLALVKNGSKSTIAKLEDKVQTTLKILDKSS